MTRPHRTVRVQPPVEVAVRAGVAWITLTRPAGGNRLDDEMLAGLVAAAGAAEDRTDVRVVVLSAQGRDFSLGLPAGRAWPEPAWPDGVGAVAAVTKPIVAAIGGDARGWGLALALPLMAIAKVMIDHFKEDAAPATETVPVA